jgi:hypothetical protein
MKQKTFFGRFPLGGHGPNLSACAETKVFWFFSSEKNALFAVGKEADFIRPMTSGCG